MLGLLERGPLCLVLGATMRVFLGGGPLCLVLGATMRVLLGGGPLCLVLGAPEYGFAIHSIWLKLLLACAGENP